MRVFTTICFLSLVFALQSCTEKAGSWKNAQIDNSKREDFHKLNDEVLKYLIANDFKSLRLFLSKELIDDHYSEINVGHISNYLTDDKYALLDEYYVVNKYRDQDTIKIKGNGINRYMLQYPGTEQEMYIAFFAPKTIPNKYLITVIYAKFNYGWKVCILDYGQYTINGKTAPELYKLATENYKNNYLIDAVNNMALAVSCVRPSNIWQYAEERELQNFYMKLLDEANEHYKFPFEIKQVPTRPQIIRVYNETTTEGSFPMVYYLTKINLKDTVAVKKENELIKKEIGNIMPGIDKNKKYILYSAFNKRPNVVSSVDHFDITEKLP